jgi:hypothetical protein
VRGDLDYGLLLRIMGKLGEMRDVYPNLVTTSDLLPVMDGEFERSDLQKNLIFISRHLIHLEQRGYVEMGRAMANSGERWVRLTAQGEIFVQPELAEFGNRPATVQVVNYILNKIEISVESPEEKASWAYRVRSAAAEQGTDLLAKVIVEAGKKFLGLP